MSEERLRLAAVIGWPAGHSVSPVLHDYWFRKYGILGVYMPLSVRPEDFAGCIDALLRMEFAGANVTVPHKETAFALCSEHDSDALATHAVNTLVFAAGKVRGLNTDVYGFAASLAETVRQEFVKSAPSVVLGAGGAACAVVLALEQAGAPEIRVVNRTRARAENLARALSGPVTILPWDARESALSGAGLLVNATSLGMEGAEALEISLEKLPREAVVADIVYNPLPTNLLKSAAMRGHRTLDGLGMLMHQGAKSFAAWFGVEPGVTPAVRVALEKALGG
ncbi:MAG: shikimate dehydrogenase [Alphaproteobacteria bacterium]